jgi:hypothetical protein
VGTREKLFIGESGPRQFKISVDHGRTTAAGLYGRTGRPADDSGISIT